MVILKNIRKTAFDISADYYPEEESKKGFMKVGLNDGQIIEHEESGMMAPIHVRYELVRLSKLDNPPEEKTVIWY